MYLQPERQEFSPDNVLIFCTCGLPYNPDRPMVYCESVTHFGSCFIHTFFFLYGHCGLAAAGDSCEDWYHLDVSSPEGAGSQWLARAWSHSWLLL